MSKRKCEHSDLYNKTKEVLHGIAFAVDKLLNRDLDPRKTGFVLLAFDFGEAPTSNRINYVSNTNRDDAICAMKEFIARAEGRHIEETQTPEPGIQ